MTYFFKRAETVLGVTSGVSLIICWWMNHPELILIFTISISLLILLNFLFLKQIIRKSRYKFTFMPQRVFTLYGFSSTAIAIALIGVVFRQMFLDGADFLLICGMAMLVVSIFIHAFIFGIKRNKNAVMLIKRLFIYFLIAFFFYFISNKMFVYLNLRKYPEYARLVEEHLNNPDDIELRIKVNEARKKISKE